MHILENAFQWIELTVMSVLLANARMQIIFDLLFYYFEKDLSAGSTATGAVKSIL